MPYILFIWLPIFHQLVFLGEDTLKRPANSALDVMTMESDTSWISRASFPLLLNPREFLLSQRVSFGIDWTIGRTWRMMLGVQHSQRLAISVRKDFSVHTRVKSWDGYFVEYPDGLRTHLTTAEFACTMATRQDKRKEQCIVETQWWEVGGLLPSSKSNRGRNNMHRPIFSTLRLGMNGWTSPQLRCSMVYFNNWCSTWLLGVNHRYIAREVAL